jgi:hypothetical protein
MADELPTMEPPPELASNVEQLFADGYGDEDVADYVRGFKEGYTQASPAGYAGKVTQGLTLGYADEIKGALRAPFTGNSRLYETARARGQLARASKDAPVTSAALEIGGAVVPGLTGGALIARALGPAAGVIGNIGRGAAAGAAEGAAYGAGNEVGGAEARAAGAIPGAAVGGLVGAAASPLAELVTSVFRRGRAGLTSAGGDAQARRALRTVLDDTGDTATSIGTRMREAQSLGVPMTLGETMGRQGVDLMEAAAQAPGSGRQAIEEQIGGRQWQQSHRLVEALRNVTGVTDGSVDRIARERAARSAAGRVNYAALGTVDAPDEVMRPLWDFLQTGPGKAAYARASEFAEMAAARGEGTKLPSLKEIQDGARLTAGEADIILQGLEASAQSKMMPGMVPGGLIDTGDSIQYSKQARFLRDRMERHIPEFEKARSEWAAPSKFIEAIKQGDKARLMDLDTFKSYWRGLDSAQQEGVKIGLVNDLKADLERFAAGPTANAARKLAKEGALREKLRLALGPQQADELLHAVDLENIASENAAQVLGGPATARRIGAQEALGEEPVQGFSASPQGILARAWGTIDQYARRNVRQSIARLGLTTDPDEAERIIDAILNAPPTRPRGAIPAAVLGGPAGAAGAAIADQR